jgi:hypothetical protein
MLVDGKKYLYKMNSDMCSPDDQKDEEKEAQTRVATMKEWEHNVKMLWQGENHV